MNFKGAIKGVALVDRGENDRHVCIQVLTEDDGQWFNSGTAFSNYWLDELIQQLQVARDHMEKSGNYVHTQWGWERK